MTTYPYWAFLTDLLLRDEGTGERFTLIEPLTYWTVGRGFLTVPLGFVTDFASVPRGLWNVFPRTGPWDKASVLHDYLYATGLLDRADADAIFLEAMAACGVPAWKRYVMYWGVRIGGQHAWDADAAKRAAKRAKE